MSRLRVIVAGILFLAAYPIFSEAVLIRGSKEVIRGKIVAQSIYYIRIDVNGEIKEIQKDKILRIVYRNINDEEAAKIRSEVEKPAETIPPNPAKEVKEVKEIKDVPEVKDIPPVQEIKETKEVKDISEIIPVEVPHKEAKVEKREEPIIEEKPAEIEKPIEPKPEEVKQVVEEKPPEEPVQEVKEIKEVKEEPKPEEPKKTEPEKKKPGNMPTRAQATLRSALIPGWGQFTTKRKLTGVLYPTLLIFAVGATYMKYRMYESAQRDYNTMFNPPFDQQVLQATSGVATTTLPVSVMNWRLYDQKETVRHHYEQLHRISYFTAGLYLWNILDAYLFYPKDESGAELKKGFFMDYFISSAGVDRRFTPTASGSVDHNYTVGYIWRF